MGLSAPGAPRPSWVLPSAASRLSWRIHCLRTAAFGISMAALTAQAAPKDCGGPKVSEILAVSTSAAPSVRVDCNLRLDPRTVVSKQLIYEGAGASGVTLDCNGATLRGLAGAADGIRLLITSRDLGTSPGAQRWQAPQDISIRNCRIEGSVRIRGMAFNGEDRTLSESSRRAGHTIYTAIAARAGTSGTRLRMATGSSITSSTSARLRGRPLPFGCRPATASGPIATRTAATPSAAAPATSTMPPATSSRITGSSAPTRNGRFAIPQVPSAPYRRFWRITNQGRRGTGCNRPSPSSSRVLRDTELRTLPPMTSRVWPSLATTRSQWVFMPCRASGVV